MRLLCPVLAGQLHARRHGDRGGQGPRRPEGKGGRCSGAGGICARRSKEPPGELARLERDERERAPKAILAATAEYLGSIDKVKPVGPDARRLAKLRHDLFRALETAAALDPADFDEPVDPYEGSPQVRAIELLGEWRDADASYLLAHNIRAASDDSDVPLGPLACFPAAQALVQIGSPAIDVMLRDCLLDGRVDDADLRLFAWVIYLVDGKDLGLARLKLKAEEWSKARESLAANSLRLLAIYKGIDFDDPQQWPRPAIKAVEKARSRGREKEGKR